MDFTICSFFIFFEYEVCNLFNRILVIDSVIIVEPSGKELVDTLLPFYIQSALYAKLLESEVCEQGARSNAMENATNNAKDLLNDLNIEFNKARQAAITQEITEIVAASKAV